jgi:hypothetical protein
MNSEEKLSKMNEGRHAQWANDLISPYLSDIKDTAVRKLQHLYRTGAHTEAKLLAGVAELCALEDLEATLIEKIRTGDRIARELQDGR